MKRRFAFSDVLGLTIAGLAAASAIVVAVAGGAATETVAIKTLSTDPALVTGGDVLVQVSFPSAVASRDVKVALGSRDITADFRAGSAANTLVGLVTGLVNGKNTLNVMTKPRGAPDASLEITNYPITGPVFSGPWIQPFICQTEAFTLPDGSKLGAPLDANCSARTVVQYVYRSTQPAQPAPAPA